MIKKLLLSWEKDKYISYLILSYLINSDDWIESLHGTQWVLQSGGFSSDLFWRVFDTKFWDKRYKNTGQIYRVIIPFCGTNLLCFWNNALISYLVSFEWVLGKKHATKEAEMVVIKTGTCLTFCHTYGRYWMLSLVKISFSVQRYHVLKVGIWKSFGRISHKRQDVGQCSWF